MASHKSIINFKNFFILSTIFLTIASVIFTLNRHSETFLNAPAALLPAGMTPGIQETQPMLNIDEAFGKMPLYFVENQGQMDARVQYSVQGRDKALYFTTEGITLVISQAVEGSVPMDESRDYGGSAVHPQLAVSGEVQRWVLKLDFVGANTEVQIQGEEPTLATISYFNGKPEEWHTSIPTYSRLVYRNLWEGIDLVFGGTSERMKYEFRVQPGADPAQIQLAYRGANELRLNEEGGLEVVTGLGVMEDEAPVAWQEINGERAVVEVGYRLQEERQYGFEIGQYDPAQTLVIDPEIIVYAGYLGGSNEEQITGVAVDSAGTVYLVGTTSSNEASFPVSGGPDLTYNGGMMDVFVAKLSPDGSGFEYVGYIGGSENDWASGIAVDDSGAAYITGYTASDETSFPVVGGPDVTFNGGWDAYVIKVHPNGTSLIYSGYIGGNGVETSKDIDVDASGAVFITGDTSSNELSFPVSGGPDLTYNGGETDAFIAKMQPNGSGLVYAGYIGGESDEEGMGLAVDEYGAAYVVGKTESPESTFPVMVGPDLTYNGGWTLSYIGDAFIAKVKPDGSDLVYAGYIGGIKSDRACEITIDASGAAYVVGETHSDETSFPVSGGPGLVYMGELDTFLAKVLPDGSDLVYAGYIAGSNNETPYGIEVDSSGAVYVVGRTSSTETSFPVTGSLDLTYNGGSHDAYVAKILPDGSGFSFLNFIGGSELDTANDLALDSNKGLYIVGSTESNETSFPVQNGPDLTYNGGDSDAFVLKLLYDAFPEIGIKGNSYTILDGDSTPATQDFTDFGSANINGETVSRIFTIENLGDMALLLDGSPKVVVGGTNASDFSVTIQPDSPIMPAGSTPFTVVFDPSAEGVRTAEISIVNNDTDENPYTFVIQGTGTVDHEVAITIGATILDPILLAPNEAQQVQYALDGGPVVIQSNNGTDIVASLNQWRRPTTTGGWTGVTQSMALPIELISNKYVIPRYDDFNDKTLYQAVLMANVDTVSRDITVTIGGTTMGTYTLGPSESRYEVYNIVGGPIVVSSVEGAKIVASLYELKRAGDTGQWNGQSEMMGVPQSMLSDRYLIPIYFGNWPTYLDASIVFANADTRSTTIEVYIGGVKRGSYSMPPNTSKVVRYALDGGPVLIQSNDGAKIVASLNQWRRPTTGGWTGVTQSMALQYELISNKYFIPRYDDFNNKPIYQAVLMANVDTVSRDITVKIGSTTMGTYTLGPSESRYEVYDIVGGPIAVSSVEGAKIVASLYELKRAGDSGQWNGQSEMMGIPQSLLSDTYLIPIYFGNWPTYLDASINIGAP